MPSIRSFHFSSLRSRGLLLSISFDKRKHEISPFFHRERNENFSSSSSSSARSFYIFFFSLTAKHLKTLFVVNDLVRFGIFPTEKSTKKRRRKESVEIFPSENRFFEAIFIADAAADFAGRKCVVFCFL